MLDTIQSTIDTRYYPMLVVGNDETDAVSALTHIWEQYKVLPQKQKAILLSAELPERLKKLQDIFHIDNGIFKNITICVRKIFFGELSLPECEAKIGSILATTGGGDPNQAKAIVEFIEKEILTIQPKPEAEEIQETIKPQRVTMNISLLQALSKYQNLGNQLITRERIRVKSQPEPVRPSLFYWLKYYRDELGVGQHDSVQRGQFLFRSENGKQLSAEERERLALILKSVEEDFPLSIDTERQEIVFPVFSGVMVNEGLQTSVAPASARMTHSPAFIDTRANDERAKKFTPANAPVLRSRDTSQQRDSAATQGAAGGLRMGRGMHFSNLEQVRAVTDESYIPAQNNVGNMSFSANHIFPAEKEITKESVSSGQTVEMPVQKPAQQEASPVLRSVASPSPKPNPFHIHPVSLGKKK